MSRLCIGANACCGQKSCGQHWTFSELQLLISGERVGRSSIHGKFDFSDPATHEKDRSVAQMGNLNRELDLREGFKSVPNKYVNNIIGDRDAGNLYYRRAITGSVHDDALEHGSFLCRFSSLYSNGPQRVGAALPNLLAPNLRFRQSTWLFNSGRTRPDPGFFSYGP